MHSISSIEHAVGQAVVRGPYAAFDTHIRSYRGLSNAATAANMPGATARTVATAADEQEDFIIDTEAAIADFGDAILRLALCRLGNRSDAEDVVQEVFLKLCQRQTPFASNEHLKAWLLRVALNCTVDVRRDPYNQKRVALDVLQHAIDVEAGAGATGVAGVAGAGAGAKAGPGLQAQGLDPRLQQAPQAQQAGGPLLDAVPAAVASLPEKQRIAVHLFYFEDYSVKEIAAITDERSSTVRSHLHRARKALKTFIERTTKTRRSS